MDHSPLVIVGIGGSGTRVFARLAEASGRHMGALQNDSNDALALYELADRWCEPAHRALESGETLAEQGAFEADLEAALSAHRAGGDPARPWGWKQPRSIHLLAALEQAFPGEMRVLHVMRDGRDLALGQQIHLQLTWRYTLSPELRDATVPKQLAQVWGAVNELAADFGESELGERYRRVSLEDLCADPGTAIGAIAELGGCEVPAARAAEIVTRPSSIGRWREADPALVEDIVETAHDALVRFGYPIE